LKLNRACVALLFSLLPSVNPAFGATLTSGWYMGIAPYQGGSPQVTVNNGPPTVTPQQLSAAGPHVCPGFYCYDSSSSALLFGSATADAVHGFSLHGFVQASDSFTSGPQAPAPGPGAAANSFANFGFTFADVIHFGSGNLAPGTPISFTMTEYLDSTITATAAGICNLPIGLGYTPNGSASISVLNNGGPAYGSFALNPIAHDSCGRGSDLLSLSGTFQSTVGGDFALLVQFSLSASAGAGNAPTGTTVTGQTTVDAGNTGFLTVQVLTPGVTFTSDSGASFSVPEPATGLLLFVGTALFGLRRYSYRKA
jgi:PEP-CTERM motif